MNQIIKAGALVCALAMLEWNPAAVAEEKRLGDYIYVPAMSEPSSMGAISLRVEGVKSGELNYVVYKGVIFKTYEGKLIQSGIRSKTAGTIQSYEFEFSVRDPELARRLMLEGGRSVELHYKEYFGALPWRGFTKFVVDSVVSSSPAPSRQGAAPAPGAGLSEL